MLKGWDFQKGQSSKKNYKKAEINQATRDCFHRNLILVYFLFSASVIFFILSSQNKLIASMFFYKKKSLIGSIFRRKTWIQFNSLVQSCDAKLTTF